MLSTKSETQKSQSLRQSQLILLVEDNSEDEVLTLQALDRCNIPHQAIVSHDGMEALNYLFGTRDSSYKEASVNHTPAWETNTWVAAQNPNPLPQLILLNIQLPKMSGLDVLQKIRSCDRTKLIPVIILSTSAEKEELLQSYNLGCNSYIRKGVNFSEFVQAIKQVGIYWLKFNKSLS